MLWVKYLAARIAQTISSFMLHDLAKPQRSAYRFAVEISAYIASGMASKGWGTRLYESLFGGIRRLPVHVVLAGIALPNDASVALHEKFGMTKVARFSEVGYKFGQWLDAGYWQVKLDSQ